MEFIAKANRQLRKSVSRTNADEYKSTDIPKLSINPSSVPDLNLHCAFHNGHLKDPRRLACSHSFCYECISDALSKSNRNRLVCPICGTAQEIDQIDDLYIDYSLMRQLNNSAISDETDEIEQLSNDVSRTLRLLKEAENACDGAMAQIRQMNADVLGMKSSIIEKRKALEAKFNAAKQLDDGTDGQHRAFTCLGYDCNFMQETIRLAQTNAFTVIRDSNANVHHTSILVKGADLFNIWLKDEQPMSEDQLKKATQLISQIWLSQENPYQMYTDEDSSRRARGEFAKSLASSFRSHFSQTSNRSSTSSSSNDDDPGVWTAIIGSKKLLDFYVYSHQEYYICLEIQKMRIVVYRCVEDSDCFPVDPGRPALFETFVRQRLDDVMRKRKKDPHHSLRPAQYVSENLKLGLNGGLWHCVGGPSKTYAIHTTGERASQTVVTVDGYEYGVWQCNCAILKHTGSKPISSRSAQIGQSSRYTEEVEYDEPFCLD